MIIISKIKRVLRFAILSIAALVVLVLAFAAYSNIAVRLEYVQLPSGATLGRGSFYSDVYSDIVLRRPDGAVVVDGNIAFVCFKERYV